VKYIGPSLSADGDPGSYGMMREAKVAGPHPGDQARLKSHELAGYTLSSLDALRSWVGLGNQEAAQKDAQAQAQEDAQEDAMGAAGARLTRVR
jgi:hypothetical protein